MEKKFEVEFLPDAVKFMNGLDKKSQEKIYYNIRKAQITNDPELFKKLTATIWEFRTYYNQTYYRLFAFWDRSKGKNTMVLATNGLKKKTGKTPKTDISVSDTLNKNNSSYAYQKTQVCPTRNDDRQASRQSKYSVKRRFRT